MTEIVVTAMTATGAKRLTFQLKLMFGSIADQVEKVTELIGQAKSGRADVALGYKSWTAYCETEFAGSLPRLERQHRLELVAGLTDLGMSSRAIAPIAGVTQKTVIQDRQTQVIPPVSPEQDHDDVVDAEIVEDIIPATDHRPQILGRDGKVYNPPAPVKPRRRPVPDAYRDAIYNLQKAIERLERLHQDDRFTANRKALRDLHWRRLSDMQEQVFDLENHLSIGRRPGDDDLEVAL